MYFELILWKDVPDRWRQQMRFHDGYALGVCEGRVIDSRKDVIWGVCLAKIVRDIEEKKIY